MHRLFDHLWNALGFVVVTALAVGVAALIVRVATASGKPDYCYVSSYTPNGATTVYQLVQHRAWRLDDVTSGYFPTHREAVEAAEHLGCGIR